MYGRTFATPRRAYSAKFPSYRKKKVLPKRTYKPRAIKEVKETGHAKKSDPFYKAWESYKPYTTPVETKGLISGSSFTKNPSMEPLRNAIRETMIGKNGLSKNYSFVLGAALAGITSSAGYINNVIAASTVTSSTDFTSFATIFDEFFVTKFVVKFEPTSRYNWLTGVGPTTQVTSFPILIANLQHAMPAYSSYSNMANNPAVKLVNSSDPFHFTWVNVERFKDTTLVNSSSAATPVQGWCQTSATPAGAYTGQMQIFGPNTGTGMQATSVYGQYIVQYHLLFRCRQ